MSKKQEYAPSMQLFEKVAESYQVTTWADSEERKQNKKRRKKCAQSGKK